MAFVQKIGPSKYKARYRDPSNRERSKTFKKTSDADRFAASVETDMARGLWVSPDRGLLRFSHYAAVWLSTLEAKPKTIAGYESILNRWVLPRFGEVRISRVTWNSIEEFKVELLDAGKSAQTTRNILNVVKPILQVAVRDGAIPTNPAHDVRLPKQKTSTVARFETSETITALAESMDPQSGLIVLVAAFTGLRAGECAALRVGDVDLLRKRLTVRESVSEVHGRALLESTKNGKIRAVALPPSLCDRLANHFADRCTASDPTSFVFTSPDGSILRHSNFYKRIFKPATESFGLDGFRFHDLRHTCAAMLIQDGAHPRAIMERLGHSSITVTLDRYGHLFPALDEALTEGLERRLQEAFSDDVRPAGGLSQLRATG